MSNWTKRQKEVALMVLAIVLLAGSAAYSYFSLYVPARDARMQSEQLLSSEKEVLMALQAQQKSAPIAEKVSTSGLQQKVAVEPMSELILLQVEQAELISGTLVTAVNFAEAPLTLLQPVEGLENIQEIETTVEFNAIDYKSITTFLREIEEMERIMVIDSINFASNAEVTEQEQKSEPITVAVSFSAFYRPDLIKLEDTLPKVDAPAPAKKANPLPQNDGTDLVVSNSSDVEKELEVDVDVDVEAEQGSSSIDQQESNEVAVVQSATVHQVATGDTLSSISQKYYGNSEGETLIQQANNLTGSMVKAGQTLTIPKRP